MLIFSHKICQVLSVLKTRQVTHYVLNHLNGYIKNLEKVGLLEGKEVSHLHDAVQVPILDSLSSYVFATCCLSLSISLFSLT